MNDINMTEQESKDLALHVDLCAQRYLLLEKRLHTLEIKVDQLAADIAKSSKSISTVIITSAGTVVASVMGLLVAIILKF